MLCLPAEKKKRNIPNKHGISMRYPKAYRVGWGTGDHSPVVLIVGPPGQQPQESKNTISNTFFFPSYIWKESFFVALHIHPAANQKRTPRRLETTYS